MDSLDPALFDDDEMRAALVARDIGTLYRYLRRLGISQRQMAQLTGQSQSEVSEIIVKGRQVRDVRVLERIADGLGIPRARLGVSYGEEPAEAPPAEEEVDEAVKRRNLIATATMEVVGQVLMRDEPVELALPSGQPLPSRLGISDVHAVRAVTEQLRGVARNYGGQADMLVAAATTYTRWLQAPAPDAVETQFVAALAELYTEAGWCCYDSGSGLDGTGCFTRALRLAGKAGDTYGVANAARQAGVTLVRAGHPNDALKLFQLGQLRLSGFRLGRSTPAPGTDDPRLPSLKARLGRQSAAAYALMGGCDEAIRCLTEANDGWEPRGTFECASGHFVTAAVQLDLGQLEAAERSATSALRAYGENHRRDRTQVELLRAEVHVRAGEPHGLSLAHQAIEAVSTLHSVAARVERLMPLATALEARPGTDARDLARQARQVAATRT